MLKTKAVFSLILAASAAYAGTVTGTLLGPSGLPIKNGTLSFNLQQAGLMVGSGSVVPTTASCYTSTDGSLVGVPNPLTLPSISITYGAGSMAPGIYYVEYTFYDTAGNRTLASPELQVQLTATGSLIIAPPAAFPANAVGITAFVGPVSGAETGQGNTVGATQVFDQNETPVTTGTTLPGSNASVCSIAFNDTIIPYSGYNVSLVSSSGNAYPGWPQAWQLNGGLNGTVNVSNGAPLWNGVVIYPQPLLSQPLNHGPQSISGLLNLTGYNLLDVGALGVGTSTPAWPIDVENGYINSSGGYLFNGGAGASGQCLVSNGTFFGPGSCGTSPLLYYQRIQRNTTLFSQEPFLSFSGNFNVADNPGSTQTAVDLQPTSVAAGSYTNPNITVDAYGRIQAATNGSSIPGIQALIITTGICTTPSGTAGGTCGPVTAAWPTAFASASYSVTCTTSTPSGTGGAQPAVTIYVGGQTATSFQYSLQEGQGSSAGAYTVAQINCIGVHP